MGILGGVANTPAAGEVDFPCTVKLAVLAPHTDGQLVGPCIAVAGVRVDHLVGVAEVAELAYLLPASTVFVEQVRESNARDGHIAVVKPNDSCLLGANFWY